MERHSFHHDSLLGDLDFDSEPYLRSDPEAESVRSHPSSHLDADQTLLPHSPAAIPARAQTQRLQRRRHQYYYSDGLLVPVPAAATPPHRPSATEPPPTASHQTTAPHKRAKSYTASGNASSWLLGSTSAFAEAKRQSWTGERREIRKLQKYHPVGSARPGFTVEIGNDGEGSTGGVGTAVDREGAKGSVLGVRRKMERLRGLYRRGEKEAMGPSDLR